MSIKKWIPLWLKRPISKGLIYPYRRATASKRALPNFIIIGAQKAGSTSLYRYMEQHPQIVPSHIKEVQFFDGGLNPTQDAYNHGGNWYRSHFPTQKSLAKNKITFEANPNYCFNPLAPSRIKETLPNVKLIFLMRNPTERALSHYFHMKRKNIEKHLPLEAMNLEATRLEEVIKEKDYKNAIFRRFSYKLRGHYSEQYLRYLQHFDNDQILVIPSEKLYSNPKETLKRAFRFVGVDPEVKISDLRAKNVGSNRVMVSQEVYEELDSYFKPLNEKLFETLGEEFDW